MPKNPPANAEDPSLIPGLGRFPGKGNGNPLQYSCLENPRDRGGWRAIVHGVAKSQELDTAKVSTHEPEVGSGLILQKMMTFGCTLGR